MQLPQSDLTVRDPLQDFNVKVTRRDCEKGFHGHWKTEVDNDFLMGQVCIVCGKKAMYQKQSVGISKKLDEIAFRDNHKLDFLQPFLPDGSVNKDFATYYGDPHKLKTLFKDLEKVKAEDHKKLLQEASDDERDAAKPDIFFTGE